MNIDIIKPLVNLICDITYTLVLLGLRFKTENLIPRVVYRTGYIIYKFTQNNLNDKDPA